MKLQSCYIEGFGKLNRVTCDFKDGLNTFVKENGWGKSTFAAFIRVMFYGFEGEAKRNDIENERRRYKPWAGTVYGGELVFSVGNRKYLIQRTFGAKKSEDSFALYDANTHVISRDYTENIGEELFSIDSKSFANTVYIEHNRCLGETTDGVRAKIGNISEQLDDMANYDSARRILKDVINSKSPNKRTGELYKEKRRILELNEHIRRQQSVEADISKLKNDRKLILQNQVDDAKRRHLIEERDRAEAYFPERVPDAGELRSMITLAREYENTAIKAQDNISITGKVLIVIIVLMLLLSVAFVISGKTAFAMVCAGFAIFIFVMYICSGAAHRKKRQHVQKMRYQLDEYVSKLGFMPDGDIFSQLVEIRSGLNEYMRRCNEIERYINIQKKTGNVTNSGDITIEDHIAEYDRRILQLQGELDAIHDASQELTARRELYEKNMHRYDMISMTYELLEKSREKFTARYMSPVKNAFDVYYRCFDGEVADQVRLDSNMELKYRDAGMYRDIRTQSKGNEDIMGLCLRAAIIDAMYTEEKPVLICDDPFVNLDDRNISGALDMLDILAKKYQIIYFTCSENRVL